MGICLHIGHRSCIVSSLTAPLSSRETETAPSKNQVVVCDFSASWRGGVIVAEFHLWKGTSHDPLTEMVDGHKELTVTDQDGKDLKFVLDDDAKIQLNDKDTKLKELKKGDEITVTYEKKDGKLIASKIECKRD